MTSFIITKRSTGAKVTINAATREAALASLIEHLFEVEEIVPDAPTNLFGESLTAGLPAIVETPLEDFVAAGWERLKADFPGVGAIQAMTDKRRKAIAARAGEIMRATKIDLFKKNPRIVWERIFHEIRKSMFLTGRAPPGRGRLAPFKLTIDYVVRPSEFAKIFEGAYDDSPRPGAAATHDAETGREFSPTERAGRAVLGSYRFAD